MGDAAAGLEVSDLLLHQHPALERCPGNLVLLGCGAVLGVEVEGFALAGLWVCVHEAVGCAGDHEPGLPGGQVLDRRFQPVCRVLQSDLELVPSAHPQRVGVGMKAGFSEQLGAGRPGRDPVRLNVGEVDRLEARRVAGDEVEAALQAVDGQGGAIEGLVAAIGVLEGTKSRRVKLQLVEGGSRVRGCAQPGVAVAVRDAFVVRIRPRVADRQAEPGRDRQFAVAGDAAGRRGSGRRVLAQLHVVGHVVAATRRRRDELDAGLVVTYVMAVVVGALRAGGLLEVRVGTERPHGHLERVVLRAVSVAVEQVGLVGAHLVRGGRPSGRYGGQREGDHGRERDKPNKAEEPIPHLIPSWFLMRNGLLSNAFEAIIARHRARRFLGELG